MTDQASEPKLDPAAVAELQKGIAEFNSGKFFECHDTLEEIWRVTRGPARNFLQGLIQVSVGFYHLSTGNLRGGGSQLGKGLKNLEPYPDTFAGVEVASLRREVQVWLDRIRQGQELRDTVANLPKLKLR